MSVKIRTARNGTIGIIEIKGPLIGDETTDEFRLAVADFLEQGIKSLIVNLQKVSYLNSSGIGAIISAHASYSKGRGTIKLAGVSSNVQNLFVVTKLIDIFDVYNNVDEAIEDFPKLKS